MVARLPVVGSTAKSTSFCSARLDGPGGLHLYFDGNGKVTASNGTLHDPKPNAFSLPAAGISGIEHCPQSTPTCRKACYVEGLNKAQPDLYALYEQNAANIRTILADEDLANDWAMHVAHWITTNAAGGFRWHVSGDLFSMQYAEWIADVCRESPSVRHWIYTRSFDFLGPLVGASTINGGNLALNLSCDVDNYHAAREAAETWEQDGGAPRLCYLTVDGVVPASLAADDTVFPDYPLRLGAKTFAESDWWQSISQFQRGLVCPVDVRGKSERVRCGLNNCDRCLR